MCSDYLVDMQTECSHPAVNTINMHSMHSGHAVIVQSMCSQCAITPLQYANSAPIVRFHKPSQFRSHLVRYFTKLCTSAIVSPQRTVLHLAMDAVVVVTLGY